MASAKVPPARLVRVVERARHSVSRLHQRMVPPMAAMMEMITGAWAAQAITVAADLGIADALANGPLSADDLAARVGADAESLSRLLRALIGRGIFRQRADGRYELTPLAETLRTDVPFSAAGFARWVGSPQHREHWSRLLQVVQTGQPSLPALRNKSAFEYLADEPELAAIFNNAMTSGSEFAIPAVVAAYEFASYPTIIDVGGGLGRLLSAVLEATPGSRGVLFDLPQVVEAAPALLTEHGVADRVRIVEGSFFESVPEGGDAYLLKNVIHDWADDDAVKILRNVRAAARTGAHLLLVEFVIADHDRDTLANWADIEMMVAVGARERTADEYRRLYDKAGFRLTRVVETASPFSVIEGLAV